MIGAIFIVMSVVAFFRTGPEAFASRWRTEGVWIVPETETDPKNSGSDIRREVPLGSTEPQ